MIYLIGLGNPGKNYSRTKHNFGFWVVDRIVKKHSISFKSGKGNYLSAQEGKLICIKPTTYMNKSGLAALDIMNFYKGSPKNILVIYDDIDLPLGRIKFKKDGGTGGHKGIESIIYHLKTEEFNRLRIGIATSENMRPSERYVLSPFNKKDVPLKNQMIEKACDGINYFLKHDITKTMNKYNEKLIKEGE
tara:strand:+ start:5131 stop:5700 length:570 start_codon:yes stop_codon:yes gene_type:complete